MKKIIVKSGIIIVLIISIVLTVNFRFIGNTDNTENYGINRDDIFTTNFNSGSPESFAKDKTVDGLLFQQLSYVYNPNTNLGYIEIAITNTESKVYKLDGFQVTISNKKGKKLTSLDLDFRVDIEHGNTYRYNFEVSGDKVGAVAFEVDYVPKKADA